MNVVFVNNQSTTNRKIFPLSFDRMLTTFVLWDFLWAKMPYQTRDGYQKIRGGKRGKAKSELLDWHVVLIMASKECFLQDQELIFRASGAVASEWLSRHEVASSAPPFRG